METTKSNLEIQVKPLRPMKLIDCDYSVSAGNEISIEKQITSTSIDVDLDYELDLDVDMSLNCINFDVDTELVFKIVGGGGEYPDYAGPYIVVPKSVDQELQTKDKTTRRNVIVKEVPTTAVSNPQGGFTFTIL